MTDPNKQIIDAIIAKEGGFSNDSTDLGGRTDKGISERAHPDAWSDNKITDEEARAIYEQKYLKHTRIDQIPDHHLRHHVADFAVNSGPFIAIQKLQIVLRVTVDGVIGPETLAAIQKVHPEAINNGLVAERVKLIGRIVVKNPSQLKFLNGWLERSLSFL